MSQPTTPGSHAPSPTDPSTRDGGPVQGNPAGLERLLSAVLRAGTWLSVSFLLLGMVLTLARPAPAFLPPPSRDQTSPRSDRPPPIANGQSPIPTHPFTDALSGWRVLDGRFLVALGLLILIATPVARVAVSLAHFAARRDRLYAALAAIVLVLLIVSVVVGRFN